MADVWPDTFEIDMLTLNIIPPGERGGSSVLSSQLQQGVLYNPLPPTPNISSVPADVIEKAKEEANVVFNTWISHHPSEILVAQENSYNKYISIIEQYLSIKNTYAKQEAANAAANAAAKKADAEHKEMLKQRVANLDSGKFTREKDEKIKELKNALQPFIDQIAHLELQILQKNNLLLDNTIRNISVDGIRERIEEIKRDKEEIYQQINSLGSSIAGYNYNNYVEEELRKKMSPEGSDHQVEIRKNKKLKIKLEEKKRRNSTVRADEEERIAREKEMAKQQREEHLKQINREVINGGHTVEGIKHSVDFIKNIYSWYMKNINGAPIDFKFTKIQGELESKKVVDFRDICGALFNKLKEFYTQYTNYMNFHLHGTGNKVEQNVFVILYDGIEGNHGIRYYVEMLHKLSGELIFREHSIQMGQYNPSILDIYLRSVIDAPLIENILSDLSEIKYFYTNLPNIQRYMFKIDNTYNIEKELFNYHVHLGEVAYIYSFNKSIKYNSAEPIKPDILKNKVDFLLAHSSRIKTDLKDIYLRIFQANIEGRHAELRGHQIKKAEYEEEYRDKDLLIQKKNSELRGLFFSSGESLKSEIESLTKEINEIRNKLSHHNSTIRNIGEIIGYYEYLIRKYSRDTIVGLPPDNFKFDVAKFGIYMDSYR